LSQLVAPKARIEPTYVCISIVLYVVKKIQTEALPDFDKEVKFIYNYPADEAPFYFDGISFQKYRVLFIHNKR